MRVYHLDCVSACPLGGLLMDGITVDSLRGRLVSHCLLLEGPGGLVLVDTGYGLRDVADPRSRLARFFLVLLQPELREEMTALRQVERLGFDPRDVKHIVLSHLDFDHAGGLDDFPWAAVHMLGRERESAEAQRTWLDRMRYRPQQWHTRAMWRTYDARDGGDRWFGFDCVRELEGLGADVLLVPLVGHTLGHAGIAVRRDQGWLFYAADAYFFHAEMDLDRPRCTPGLRFYQRMMEKDRGMRLLNQQRLRELRRKHSSEVEIFCGHDVLEFERLAGRAHREPVPRRQAPPVARRLAGTN